MTNDEILELLQKIDDGYIISEEDKKEISSVKKISWMRIEDIPESIGSLSSLQYLDLSSSQISSLPESIGSLSSLQTLYLGSTQISEFPKITLSLPKLEMLILEDINLSELPEELLSLNLDFKDSNYVPWRANPGIFINGLRLKKQPVSLFYQPRKLT